MASRSRHRSQDMGTLQPIGPRQTRLQLINDRTEGASNGGAANEIFARIPGAKAAQSRAIGDIRRTVDPTNLSDVTALLVERMRSTTGDDRPLLERAIAVSAGIVMDAVVEDDELVPGQTVPVTVDLSNGGSLEVVLDSATIVTPNGWSVTSKPWPIGVLLPGDMVSLEFDLTVAPQAQPTQPYFLERPLVGSMYDWSDSSPHQLFRLCMGPSP